jgi:hypothetical protein
MVVRMDAKAVSGEVTAGGLDATPTPVVASRRRRASGVVALGLLAIVLAIVGYRVRQGAGRGGLVGLVLRPQTAQLARDQDFNLAGGAIQRWEWIATPRQPTCRLTGQIQVIDGGGRDVEVFVLTAGNYASLSNGHTAYAFFQTEQTSAVKLDVTTSEPGRMVLAISNRFSPQAEKRVRLRKVQVVCQ